MPLHSLASADMSLHVSQSCPRPQPPMAPKVSQPQLTKIFLSDTQGGTLIIATALHVTRQVIWYSIQGKSQVSQAST